MPRLSPFAAAAVAVLALASRALGYGLAPEFGIDGIATVPVAAIAKGVVLLSDGKIVAAGSGANGLVLARFLVDGTPDATFGNAGVVTATSIAAVEGIALQGDGKLVVVGRGTGPGNPSFAVSRHHTDGTFDPSFGEGDGLVLTSFGTATADVAFAVGIQGDGKIVVGGKSNGRMAFARYASGGALDASFGSGGLVVLQTSAATDVAFRLALLPDGRIVAAGYHDVGGGRQTMLVVRLESDGTLDPTFGVGGRVVTSLGRYAGAWGMALDAEGRVLVTGAGGHAKILANTFVTLRHLDDGTVDPAFGDDGVVVTDFGQEAGSYAIALRFDGFIAAAGTGLGQSGPLARYAPDGGPDRGWGICGAADGGLGIYDLAFDVDGSLIAAGYYLGELAVGRFAVATAPLCPATPRADCRKGRSKIAVAAGAGERNKLAWQWQTDAAVAVEELGEPTLSDDYTFCLYDESELLPELAYAARIPARGACAQKECWQPGGGGFKYRDKLGSPCGIEQLAVSAGAAGGRVKMKGSGAQLGAPPLPLALPARVQLQIADGTCFEAVYEAAGVGSNDDVSFKATSD